MTTPVRLFISYSHEDAAFVARLKTDLTAAGADIWVDHEQLLPGTPNWQLAIREGIDKADAVLFVASPASARSPFVYDEIGLARSRSRRVIPLWADGNDWHDAAPLGWGATQYIDARTGRYQAAFSSLAAALDLSPTPQIPTAPSSPAVPPPPPVPVRGSIRWSTRVGGNVPDSPAVANGLIYVSSNDGHVCALAASTGEVRWRTYTENQSGVPAVADGVLFVGSADSNVYALDAISGAVKWKTSTRTGYPINTQPVVSNGLVYFGSWDRHIYAFDASSGRLRWKRETTGYAYKLTSSTTAPGVGSPAVANGLVYVAASNGHVYALDDGNGKVRWQTPVTVDEFSTPAVANGLIYFGAGYEGIYALDAASGAIRWKSSPGSFTRGSPAVSNGSVYIASSAGQYDYRVYALDAATGTIRWNAAIREWISNSPSVANGHVYDSGDKYVYALDEQTGAITWKARVIDDNDDDGINAAPLVVGNLLCVGSAKGVVYALVA